MTTIPPHITAFVDQGKATLRDLVQAVRDHEPGCGVRELPCPGDDVLAAVTALDCNARVSVLCIALVELARRP